ncbi:DUF2306 domain-containing protein [Acinetobacter sp. XS-4]|uniref:DUF2306 domain-containing protein n=1 Tax=Acinetobacter sp. XS-4 TaxID=2923375 RepID=UPI00208F87FE|nr:DUF2306 domain-containing protein [Acinetobacter sp. XS-4]USP42130.1 DUF2306 domain-containing protein [Acinetobacter sp. XS-4]
MKSTQSTNSAVFMFGKLSGGIFLSIIIISMMIAGWIALEEGKGRFLDGFMGKLSTEQIEQTIKTVRTNPTPENMRHVSAEIWGLSKLHNASHYADSKLMEQGLYYTTMSNYNKGLMVVHVLFGSVCMLFGGLQFWPYFRKKYLKAHRLIGALYIATVPIAVIASLLYLANTAPHHIYDHLVAWIGLWIFGVLSLIAITMAVFAIKKRKIYEHQAWMALSFVSLMVAPMLRWDWAILAAIFPHIDQQTLNLVTMGLMLPESLLIGYGLILINRQYARPMAQRKPNPIAIRGSEIYVRVLPILYALAIVSGIISFTYYIIGQGFSSFGFAKHLVPAALITQESSVLSSHPIAKTTFIISIIVALPLALYMFRNLLIRPSTTTPFQQHHLANFIAILTIIAGSSAFYIGWNIGLMPQNVLFSGGTMYVVNGALLVFFGIFFLTANRRKHWAYMKESLVFLICLLPFPTLYCLTIGIISFLPLPIEYILAGQGFVIPIGFSTALLFLAFFHVIYGQATREHN